MRDIGFVIGHMVSKRYAVLSVSIDAVDLRQRFYVFGHPNHRNVGVTVRNGKVTEKAWRDLSKELLKHEDDDRHP